jgi:Flp pilus assembly protein TadG
LNARRTHSRGQDLVEYALLVTFTLLALIMILDLGRAAYTFALLQNAAREGARFSVTKNSLDVKNIATRETNIRNYIRQRVPGLVANDVTITINWIATPVDVPDRVEILLMYPFDPITPFIAGIIGADPLMLNTRSTMNLEY